MKKALFTKKDGTVVNLAKIELAFGELDLETQEALRYWPHGIEGRFYEQGLDWEIRTSPARDKRFTYRAIPAPKDKKPKPEKKSEIWVVIDSKGFVSEFSSDVTAKRFARGRLNSHSCSRIVAIKRIKYRPGDGMAT